MAAQLPQDEAQRVHAFFGNSDKGFFAEVGIRAGSPTWPLETAAWTGMRVEPSPDVAAFAIGVRHTGATLCSMPVRCSATRAGAMLVGGPLRSDW